MHLITCPTLLGQSYETRKRWVLPKQVRAQKHYYGAFILKIGPVPFNFHKICVQTAFELRDFELSRLQRATPGHTAAFAERSI